MVSAFTDTHQSVLFLSRRQDKLLDGSCKNFAFFLTTQSTCTFGVHVFLIFTMFVIELVLWNIQK